MLLPDSPLLNIPSALVKRQAVFLDGLRQSAQIAIYAYERLCRELTVLAFSRANGSGGNAETTGVFLDAWAVVDSIDRFRSLWMLQPETETIPVEFNPVLINGKLQAIRDVRNVYAHIAQKIDQISALNASVSGTLHWVTVMQKDPIAINSHFIRPGVLHGSLNENILIPSGKVLFTHDTGCIALTAGNVKADLSCAYSVICSIVRFAERHLRSKFIGKEFEYRLPSDIFGSVKIDI